MSSKRMRVYIPLVQKFAARLVLFHSAVGARAGLHATDINCLRLLAGTPMTAGSIAEETGLTGPAVTALIDRLENAGYVTRERSTEDRRKITVHVVAKRVADVDALYASQGASMKALLSEFSDSEFDTITRFLERTTEVLVTEAKRLKSA